MQYFIGSVSMHEFQGNTFYCSPSETVLVPINGTLSTKAFCAIQTGADVIDMFGMHENLLWAGLGIVVGYYLFFAACYVLCLQFINHIRR